MITISKFASVLFITLIIIFGVHVFSLFYMSSPIFDNMIIEAYSVNFALAFGIYAGMFKLKETQPNNLGFIFMMGSLVKFGLFFSLFFPTYKSDGDISSLEFSSFFIPYATCLIVETKTLSKLLNNLKE